MSDYKYWRILTRDKPIIYLMTDRRSEVDRDKVIGIINSHTPIPSTNLVSVLRTLFPEPEYSISTGRFKGLHCGDLNYMV